MSFYLRYLFPYRSQLFQLVVGMLLGSVFSLILPFLTQAMVDQGIGNRNLKIDVDALSAKMIQLIEQPDYAKVLAVNARKRFLEKYDLTIFRQKILNLYREI